ncbi:hypothetical protein BDV96DRAFT_598778 [Lophiotrema nucula]|uniref:Uncharacterized protein n=1 Tax=Lophiotrema nucula TaxID=690887 RepID=A0A6A5ZBU6_9PLEO|nr:hypothetical protein BDV96DRAFT_598778 [Lophiotrema nucula]
MDHLVWPKDRKWPIPEVPCLTQSYEYDGGTWKEFPERMGWHPRSAEEWNLIFQQPTADLIAFLGCWRYFAYLGSIFLQDMDKEYLTCNINGVLHLDTAAIVTIINEAVERSSILDEFPTADHDLLPFYEYSVLSGNSLAHVFKTAKYSQSIEAILVSEGDHEPAFPGARLLTTEVTSMYDFIHLFRPQNPLSPLFVDAIWLTHELVQTTLTLIPKPYDPVLWAYLQLEDILARPDAVPLTSNGTASRYFLVAG